MSEFLTKAKFSKAVEQAIQKRKFISTIDAILYVCDINKIDPADVKKFLNSDIKDRVEAEAKSLNLLPDNETKLPI